MAGNNNRLMLYGGIAVVAVVAFIATAPSGETPTRRPARERQAASAPSRTKADPTFTEEDTNAKFSRVTASVGSAWKPLVLTADRNDRGRNETPVPNRVPARLIDGKTATWLFTGVAYIDDVPNALFENTANGEGRYVKVSEQLFLARVVAITPTSVTLVGPDGATVALKLMDDRPIVEDGPGNTPMNPLRGTIGLRRSDRSEPVAADPSTTTPTVAKAPVIPTTPDAQPAQ